MMRRTYKETRGQGDPPPVNNNVDGANYDNEEDVPSQDSDDVRTCCDYDQLEKMDTKMKLAEGVLKRCTACINNLLNHICQFTCSPNQSQFFIPAEILVNPDTQSKALFTCKGYLTNVR
ncbi:hypothetical protein C0J52_04174 [Blattella germanica]|nr:hypothetical protein C0J52_04174 [Blattella germanica]